MEDRKPRTLEEIEAVIGPKIPPGKAYRTGLGKYKGTDNPEDQSETASDQRDLMIRRGRHAMIQESVAWRVKSGLFEVVPGQDGPLYKLFEDEASILLKIKEAFDDKSKRDWEVLAIAHQLVKAYFKEQD